MLTSEYLVLSGAKALAFPIKYGQHLSIRPSDDNLVTWKAYSESELWFEATFELSTLEIINATDAFKASYVQLLLQSIKKFIIEQGGVQITTRTNYPINWGVGSSSTLIVNLAQWSGMDPFRIHADISKGSGYDIACALHNKPLIFQKNGDAIFNISTVAFDKPFIKNLYLVYSGKKKATEKDVVAFSSKLASCSEEVVIANKITDNVLKTESYDEFVGLLEKHEELMGKVLQKPVVKESYADFDGALKSLGAWGGDFILAATNCGESYVKQYFEQFGLKTVLPFYQTVLL